ncbi:MAG TPA: hypothetical protein VIX37_14270 [Candidatus Sulfotelmatobacter sp.]
MHYDHILKALEAAAKRGVPVRIVLAAPDKVLLAGSNDDTQFPSMPGLTRVTLNFLKPARSSCVAKVFRQKTMLVSLLR